MPSNFACIGLVVDSEADFRALMTTALTAARPIASSATGTLLRWQDPSGARLAITLDPEGHVATVVPSYAGAPGARLADVYAVGDYTAFADVVDGTGELLTRLAIDLEERVLLRDDEEPAGPASVVAMTREVRVFDTAAAYTASDQSLLGGDEVAGAEPRRLSPVSFVPVGMFGDPAAAQPDARVAGTVLAVTARRNEYSGSPFAVVRVQTTGMQIDLCTPPLDPTPAIGRTLSASVFLVGSMPSLAARSPD